ncbi:hypothetical protein C8R43DRAFT_1102976 [Mycena crocata]|nr:hypothetical protein C8R43DRAFT_1102976 [Mycena crocata]
MSNEEERRSWESPTRGKHMHTHECRKSSRGGGNEKRAGGVVLRCVIAARRRRTRVCVFSEGFRGKGTQPDILQTKIVLPTKSTPISREVEIKISRQVEIEERRIRIDSVCGCEGDGEEGPTVGEQGVKLGSGRLDWGRGVSSSTCASAKLVMEWTDPSGNGRIRGRISAALARVGMCGWRVVARVQREGAAQQGHTPAGPMGRAELRDDERIRIWKGWGGGTRQTRFFDVVPVW